MAGRLVTFNFLQFFRQDLFELKAKRMRTLSNNRTRGPCRPDPDAAGPGPGLAANLLHCRSRGEQQQPWEAGRGRLRHGLGAPTPCVSSWASEGSAP